MNSSEMSFNKENHEGYTSIRKLQETTLVAKRWMLNILNENFNQSLRDEYLWEDQRMITRKEEKLLREQK